MENEDIRAKYEKLAEFLNKENARVNYYGDIFIEGDELQGYVTFCWQDETWRLVE